MQKALLVAIAAAAAGCKHHPPGERTCGQVGARFYEIARADVTKTTDLPAGQKHGVIGLLAPMRDSMVRGCLDDKWSAEARACFADALDQAAFYGCEPKLSAEQRALLSKRAAGSQR